MFSAELTLRPMPISIPCRGLPTKAGGRPDRLKNGQFGGRSVRARTEPELAGRRMWSCFRPRLAVRYSTRRPRIELFFAPRRFGADIEFSESLLCILVGGCGAGSRTWNRYAGVPKPE